MTEPTPGVIGFTDIVGFTEYTAAQGDARALAMLDIKQAVVSKNLQPGDRVVKELGDGLMLWLDEPATAITTMLTIQDEMGLAAEIHDVALWVRIGLHYGRPIARGDDLIGHDVNIASRIADHASAGEVLVSENLLNAAGTVAGVVVSPLGPIEMKGIPDPVWLSRVETAGSCTKSQTWQS